MKQIPPPTITLELTQREAKILQCLMALMCEDDPYGAASNSLGIPTCEIVDVGRHFETILAKAI